MNKRDRRENLVPVFLWIIPMQERAPFLYGVKYGSIDSKNAAKGSQ